MRSIDLGYMNFNSVRLFNTTGEALQTFLVSTFPSLMEVCCLIFSTVRMKLHDVMKECVAHLAP